MNDASTHDVNARTPPQTLLPLTRHLSYRITPILLRWPVTPNQITLFSMLLGVCGSALFCVGSRTLDVAGSLLLLACFTLDNCDGEVARVRNMSSEFGARLDDIADSIVDTCFFAALGYGTYRTTGEVWWCWLGLAAAFGAAFDYFVDFAMRVRERRRDASLNRHLRVMHPKQPRTPGDRLVYFFKKLSHADFPLIVLALALADSAWLLLPLGAVGAQIYWASELFERGRGYHA